MSKIRRRIKEYKFEILNSPREGKKLRKKLLVLDLDYTLFDHRSSAETGVELMRPYLHEFLRSAYEHYDIIIWSATSMKWIIEKMKLLGVSRKLQNHVLFGFIRYDNRFVDTFLNLCVVCNFFYSFSSLPKARRR